MTGYTWLVSNALFPLHERLKGHDSVARLKQLESSQWWGSDELERNRLARLQTLLAHAAAHVPYYRELFGQIGFSPSHTTSLSVLQRLPLLSKPLVRSHQQELRSEIAGPLKRCGTGGSSGDPLVFFIGKDRITHDVAAKWRATRWWGVDIGDKEMVLWGSPIELNAQDRLKALRDRLIRTCLLPTSRMSEDDLDRFLERMRAFRPRMLFGYPYAISRFAGHAEKRGVRLDHLGVKVAFVTAERLYQEQRELIERVFGCRVANGYGGRDSGFIAHECPEGGMHISAEDIIVEILDNDGQVLPPGAPGEIIITHLATRDFPFIRYCTGDIGVLDDRLCRCGRGLPLIKEVQGRSNDFVAALDGTLFHSSALNHIFRDLGGIQQFKVVQESLDLTRVQVVPGPGFREELLWEIDRKFKARLGQGVRVLVEKTTDIPPEKSGKYRYIISHVARS